jgi:hypothetical protein
MRHFKPTTAGTWKREGDPKEYIVQEWWNMGGSYLVMYEHGLNNPPRKLEEVWSQTEWYKVSDNHNDFTLPDLVNHPNRSIECIQITEHMGFNLGNAVKYIWRADLKHGAEEDLKKAVWYIQRELALRNKNEDQSQLKFPL